MNRRKHKITLVLNVFVLAACSGGQPDASRGGEESAGEASAQQAVNACDLVTLDDVRTVYGAGMTLRPESSSARQMGPMSRSVCLYATDEAPTKAVQVTVHVSAREMTIGNRDQYIQQMNQELGDSFTYKDVGGLGVPAIWQLSDSTNGILTVFLGKAAMSVAPDPTKSREALEIATELMKKRLARYRNL